MIPATAAAAVFLTLVGAFFVFKPKTAQAWFQRRYTNNKFARRYLFARMIFKPWYPTYLKVMGVWVWMFALFFAYVVLSALARR